MSERNGTEEKKKIERKRFEARRRMVRGGRVLPSLEIFGPLGNCLLEVSKRKELESKRENQTNASPKSAGPDVRTPMSGTGREKKRKTKKCSAENSGE